MKAVNMHSDWKIGAKAQVRVITALIVRDALKRHGHENLGVFWVVAEPLLLTCGVMLVWTAMGISHGGHVSIIPFALTGYTYITLWRHIIGRAPGIMKGNASLTYHRQVRHIDSLISMAILELIGVVSAFLIVYLPLLLIGLVPPLQDSLEILGGYTFLMFFSLGCGLILASLSELSDLIHHLIPPFMYLTLPITGIFFMVDWLPPNIQALMMWSPLVNGIEMIRAGVFPTEIVVTHWSVSYLLICSIISIVVGLLLYRYVESKVEE